MIEITRDPSLHVGNLEVGMDGVFQETPENCAPASVRVGAWSTTKGEANRGILGNRTDN